MKYKSPNIGSFKALLPFLIFIAIYLGAGIYFQMQGVDMAFYQFPSVTAMFIAVLSAFCLGSEPIMFKFGIFSKGAANDNIMTMLMIYILAGAFSAVAAAMGGRDATVNLGISMVPAQYLTAGIFLISAFMGTATGTSMGTVAAIIPIAAGIGEKSGISAPLIIAACVGGAMFGDNLSMISDTTIAATKTQGCALKDKFKVNFLIALPAAIATIAVLLILGTPGAAIPDTSGGFDFMKVLPYIVVLLLALMGTNVFLVLVIGIFLALFCGGISEMISYYGGITWLINKLHGMIRGPKTAQLGIASLVSLVDCATANNTVAIIVSGDVAKQISEKYKVDPRRSASLLDIFSCIFQGIIPYGAQLLTAAALATQSGVKITTLDIVPHMWYCLFLAIFGILSIFIPYADGLCRRNPWDWEKGKPVENK